MLDIELIKNKLLGNTFIKNVYYFEEIDSTNLFAKSIEDDNVLIIAEHQTAGKGRLERVWESNKGENLTFTIKRKIDTTNEKLAYVNFFFTYCIFNSIYEFLSKKNINTSQLSIKWPNDILYESKKICGVLIESNLNKKEFIIGIGININQENFTVNKDAVSLSAIINNKVDISQFLIELLILINRDIHMLDDMDEQIYKKWKNSTDIIGKSVVFTNSDSTIKYGNVIDLQEDGGIKMLINGVEEVFYSGEIKITLIGN